MVGGGMTGCVAACRLATAGRGSCCSRPSRIGRGSTAASTALLMQEPDVDFARPRRPLRRASTARSGEPAGMRCRPCARTSPARQAAPRSLRCRRSTSRVDETRCARCERQRRRGTGPGSAPVARRGGAAAPSPASTAPAPSSPRGNAQVDPYRACLGLRRRGEPAGARLFEHSAVRRIRTRARPAWKSITDRGEVRARWAIVATGYATPEFKPLAGRFRMVEHLRHRDAAAARAGAAPHRPRRRDAVGHRAALSLPALDRRPSPAVRRPRSSAAAGSAAGDADATAWSSSPRFPGPLSGRRRISRPTTPGRACSRRRRTGCPTSARTAAIRGSCSRSATAATA